MNCKEWLEAGSSAEAELTVRGVPVGRMSRSPSQAWTTPAAFRNALARFPTWDARHGHRLDELHVFDAGDGPSDEVEDTVRAHEAIASYVHGKHRDGDLHAFIGGDNSITFPALAALMEQEADATWGIITLDAHHDTRPLTDGSSNGTPIRELIMAGLPGTRVVQIGIAPFGNGEDYATWTRDQGVVIHDIDAVRRAGPTHIIQDSVNYLLTQGMTHCYVDCDIDVVDRAFAPACPGSMPGGLQPDELLAMMYELGTVPNVHGVDLVEVDATQDVAGITVRLMAAAFVSFASGMIARTGNHHGA